MVIATPGQRLKVIRTTLGLKQEELAEKLGIKQGTYSAMESNKGSITQRHRERLIYELKVNPLFLDNGIGQPLLGDQATISDRIAELMSHFQMSIRVFCTTLGLNEAATAKFTIMLSGNQDPDDDLLQLICERFPSVSMSWLKHNQGGMFVRFEKDATQQQPASLTGQVSEVIHRLHESESKIHLLEEVNASLKDQIDLLKKYIRSLEEKGV